MSIIINGMDIPKEHELIVIDHKGMTYLYDEEWTELKEPVEVVKVLTPHVKLPKEYSYQATWNEALRRSAIITGSTIIEAEE